MSGAKEPATSAAGISRPRPVPSPRTAGSTAAAWLRVNGNWAPHAGQCPSGRPGRTWPTGEYRARTAPRGKEVVVGSPGSPAGQLGRTDEQSNSTGTRERYEGNPHAGSIVTTGRAQHAPGRRRRTLVHPREGF